MTRQCSHITSDGQPCKAAPQMGKDVCIAHDDSRAAEVAAARVKGGKKTAASRQRVEIAPPTSVRDLKRVAGEVISAVAAGRMSERQAHLIERMMAVFLKANEAADVERRLAKLEGKQNEQSN